jgi:curved DNA-binding protein CbpA/ketosteroid isomerase-like protein
MMRDYYKILGVKEGASEKEIRAHWVKLMQKLHPDRLGDERSDDQRIREINEAYDTLKHSSTRVKYDLARAYDRRKRRSYIRRRSLPIGIFIVLLILGTLYFKKYQIAIQPSPTTQNEIKQTNERNEINERNERNQIEDVRAISKIPTSRPETSVKVEKIVPEEMKKETFKEVKKAVPQEMVKIAPTIIAPSQTSPSASEEELRGREKLSKQTVLKSEKPFEAEKVVPKEMSKGVPQEMAKAIPQTNQIRPEGATTVRPHDSIDPTTPKRIDSMDAKDTIDSKTPFTQQRIDPIDPKTQSTQLTQRPDGPYERISVKPSMAKEEEVRQLFANYIERYIQKDLDGFLSFFSSKAVQNQKEGMDGIRKIYANFFKQSQQLQYQLEDLKIEIHQNGVLVKARYEVDQTLKKKGEKKIWNGPIRWTLVKENGTLKILTLDYQYQKGS